MRTFRFVGVVVCVGVGCRAPPALDPNLSPSEAFRSGYEAYKAGDAATALEALELSRRRTAIRRALWKLGRMYADRRPRRPRTTGKAMELFATRRQRICATSNPHGPDAPFVADAFVTLGAYYQSGIPGEVTADPGRARRFFAYAASYFGDSDAQYSLASMFLPGEGGDQNARQAARWFKLAARKGHVGAQAEFGHMLYEGIGMDRRPVEGLMWLSIARLSSPGDPLIQARHEAGVLDRRRGAAPQAMDRADRGWSATSARSTQAQRSASRGLSEF